MRGWWGLSSARRRSPVPGRTDVLVITSWAYADALIQTYTLPYLEMIRDQLGPGGRVHLITQEPRRPPGSTASDPPVPEGIHVIRHPYANFGALALLYTALLTLRAVLLAGRHRVRTVHAFGTSGGLHGYLVSTVLRRPLVIDSFEPHAESMVENGTWRRDGWAFRILWWFEGRQARAASALIGTTAGMREYAGERFGATAARFYVKPSCVDLERFHPPTASDARPPELDGRLVAVYAGKLGGIYLDEELFQLLAVAHERWGDRFRALLLTDAERATVLDRCRAVGLPPEVVLSRFVPHAEVPALLRHGDFAVNPVKPVPTKRYCTSIKDGEYWATGLPVLIPPGISDDSQIIAERGIGVVVDDLTPAGFAAALAALEPLLVEPGRSATRAAARRTAEELRSYDVARAVYADLYG